MYPRGANGAAQALIDSRTLADLLVQTHDPREALMAYETARLEKTATIVKTNRLHPPDFINTKVDELSGGKPFRHIDDLISQAELKRICDDYAQIAGFSREAVNPSGS
jgi:2-polyprenyl-6-methoxyphenol hydroxylase-like FAD-dependent oxidoreductase